MLRAEGKANIKALRLDSTLHIWGRANEDGQEGREEWQDLRSKRYTGTSGVIGEESVSTSTQPQQQLHLELISS